MIQVPFTDRDTGEGYLSRDHVRWYLPYINAHNTYNIDNAFAYNTYNTYDETSKHSAVTVLTSVSKNDVTHIRCQHNMYCLTVTKYNWHLNPKRTAIHSNFITLTGQGANGGHLLGIKAWLHYAFSACVFAGLRVLRNIVLGKKL